MNGEEGVILADLEIFKSTLQANGIVVTPEIEQEILLYLRERQAQFDQQVSSLGIPDRLKILLEFTKKSKAIAYCKRIILPEIELGILIKNCSQIEFTHRSKFKQFVPKDRKIQDADFTAMKKGNPRQFVAKLDQILQERKINHVHLFERGKEWHCFYFTYSDIASDQVSHWKQGSHLHYVSHLWPNLRKRQVWESFEERNVDIPSVHIRLKPLEIDTQSVKNRYKSLSIDLLSKYK